MMDTPTLPHFSRFKLEVLTSHGLMSKQELAELAHRDGFTNEYEMAKWFYDHYGFLNKEELQIIRWYPIGTSCSERGE